MEAKWRLSGCVADRMAAGGTRQRIAARRRRDGAPDGGGRVRWRRRTPDERIESSSRVRVLVLAVASTCRGGTGVANSTTCGRRLERRGTHAISSYACVSIGARTHLKDVLTVGVDLIRWQTECKAPGGKAKVRATSAVMAISVRLAS